MKRRMTNRAMIFSLIFGIVLIGKWNLMTNRPSIAAGLKETAMPHLQGKAAEDSLKQHGLFESIKAKIEAQLHKIRWSSEVGRPGVNGAWQADNSSNNSATGADTLAAPTLGNYPNVTVTLGGATTVTPDAAPQNATSIQVATNTNFKGIFAADPATGIVQVTNAHPAGTYPVTVTAFDSMAAPTTKSFTLTVQTSTACPVTPAFTNAAGVGLGTSPRFVAIGDFNGDGKQDFAAANLSSNTVSIRLGDGMGGFSGTTEVSVGARPQSVAIGDFNGDGKQDFAAANESSATVSIRLGDGMGGFSGSTNVGVGLTPVFVAIGDFNGDDRQDFAAANFFGNTVSIRLGDGMGGFSGTTEVSVGASPQSVAIGDFNGDGKQDFATPTATGQSVSIRLGDGLGGFSATTNVSLYRSAAAVVIGDFNGDGKQDFVAAHDCTLCELVSVRLGDGLGGFSVAPDVNMGQSTGSVAIGDFNGDGKQDFAAARNNASVVSIRLGNGQGGFSGGPDVGVGLSPKSVAIGDFNGDGRQDFATIDSNGASIRLGACSTPLTLGNYPNATVTLGGATAVVPDAAPLNPTSIQVATNTNFKGTFVADPTTGIVGVTNAHPVGTYPVMVTAFNGTVRVQKTFTLTVQPGPACSATTVFSNAADVGVGAQPYSVAIGDFNGDGKQDFAVANQNSNTVSIRLGDGSGGFSGSTNVSVGMNPLSAAIGDFNGDGKQDFAAANYGSNTVSIRLGDGLGGFTGATEVSIGSKPVSVAIGDFNGDGKQDFATANVDANTVSIRLGDGLGGFSGSTNVGVGSAPIFVAIGDFNGDDRQDFATANYFSNTVLIRLGDGLGGGSGTTEVSVGTTPQSVAIGDFNGDGKQDFAAANTDSSTVSIRLGDGSGGFSGTTDVGVGSFPLSVAIGDFNGDGKQDFAAANAGPLTVSIRLGDGMGGFSGSTEVGAGSYSVAIGDFNGDGWQDFATANYNSGNVSIRLGGCDLPPTLTPTGLTLAAGQTASAATIGNTTDALDAANTLQLAISGDGGMTFSNTATLNGMTVTLTDSNPGATGVNPNAMGQVIADVAASLTATSATFKLRVTDSSGQTDIQNFSVAINCPTITVTPATAANGFVGTVYSQTFTQMGGTGAITWSSTGTLPDGLTLNPSTGELAGTPTTVGSFTFTVRATDQNNCFGESQYTGIISGTGLQFYPLAHPVRLLETRSGESGCIAPGVPITANTSLTVPARGTCGGLTIPANAAAVTGNVTTVNSGGGYLTIYPSDAAQPLVANSNFAPNQILNNVFTAGLGASDGAFKIYVVTDTDVVVDITGYYAPPGAGGLFFHPLPSPVRLLETRTGEPVGCFLPGTPLTADQDFLQQGNGTCSIPDTALALVGNATTVSPQTGGYLTLFPANATRPLVASGNYTTNQVLNSPFTVGLSPSGQFKVYTVAQTELVIDVLGYYSADASDVNGAGLLFSPMTPARLLETRSGELGCFTPGTPIPTGVDTLQLAGGVCTIPATAQAIVGNATVVTPAAGGYLTFWPSNAIRPLVATSNYLAGDTFNRHFTVGLGIDGAFRIYTSTPTHLVIDVSGSFAP